jgi:hypothetical protein
LKSKEGGVTTTCILKFDIRLRIMLSITLGPLELAWKELLLSIGQ